MGLSDVMLGLFQSSASGGTRCHCIAPISGALDFDHLVKARSARFVPLKSYYFPFVIKVIYVNV